ncbi:MAG: hypothetical protein ACI4D4_07245 [Lachnospira sp.]
MKKLIELWGAQKGLCIGIITAAVILTLWCTPFEPKDVNGVVSNLTVNYGVAYVY